MHHINAQDLTLSRQIKSQYNREHIVGDMLDTWKWHGMETLRTLLSLFIEPVDSIHKGPVILRFEAWFADDITGVLNKQ